MSSSESSDDENSALLREAVDTQFINDGMFNNSASGSTKKPQQSPVINGNSKVLHLDIINQPSLRPSVDKDDQFNMLGVTPQFQQFVAKQLSILLEEKLQKKLRNRETVNNLPQKRKKGGIKLFKHSKKYVKIPKSEKLTVRRPAESESDNDEKLSAVSVNADDILNKKDVANWSTRSKAAVFKYKKTKNGTLTSVD